MDLFRYRRAYLSCFAFTEKRTPSRARAGEADTIEGWIAYGHALNEVRALFPSDEQFGHWVAENGLSQLGTHEVKRDERAAAMWAAATQPWALACQAENPARSGVFY
jgi:hypothetical protein